jgi:hypothetical protein
LDSNPRASKQAPIGEILQAYQNKTLGKPVQRQEIDDDELLQPKFESASAIEQAPIQREERPNNTGLPDNLKSGIENLSGYSMDDVRVHYNSAKPAQLQALAYTQGADIHVASGQEQYLPHEAWHVVQQKQGRVQPTTQLQDVNINDSEGLEREADVMGERAIQNTAIMQRKRVALLFNNAIQLYANNQFKDQDVINDLQTRNFLTPNNGWIPVTNLGARKENAFQNLDNRAVDNNPNGIWNWYPKNLFIHDAGDRIVNPEQINQAQTGTCGVVAIQYIQASSQPIRYVNAIADIYFNGQFNGRNIRHEQATRPGNDQSGLDNIDWLYIVPFRHIKNSVLSFRGETGKWGVLRGVTTPGTVADWMTTELGAINVDQNYVIDETWNRIVELEGQINANHVVVLYVNAGMFNANPDPNPILKIPNHFVVLNNVQVLPAHTGNQLVDLNIYTWGRLRDVRLSERQVRKFIWKIIVGTLE